jgi:hypothetical protein
MFHFELTDSGAPATYGRAVDLLRDHWDGDLRAICLPSSEMMVTPTPLRHVSSTALIHSSSGYIWLVSMWNQAWTEELVSKVDEFLMTRRETWSWQRLEVGLADAIERKVVLHKVCELDEKLSALEIPRMADAIFRRWMSLQTNFPDIVLLTRMKEALVRRIVHSADLAVAEFMGQVNPNIKALSGDSSLSLALYNYVANPAHHRERLQFATEFPLLAKAVYAAQTRSVWRELGEIVDKLKSPVRFLSKSLKVTPVAVRALRGVTATEVGAYFEAHPAELIEILDSLPAEHLPRSLEHWCVFQEQYNIAKNFFGRSPAGSVLVKARVGHALRFVVGLSRPAMQIQAQDVRKVERLREGLVQSSYSNHGGEQDHSLAIQFKASITTRVERFLGHLSWGRLLELSRKWEKCYAEAVESNIDSINFVSGHRYWNYIPEGQFVAPNGQIVRCLSTAGELKNQGVTLDICLANAGTRANYHHECLRGSVAIFSVHDSSGVASSTAEFRLSTVKAYSANSGVHFEWLQHTRLKNQSPAQGDIEAIDAFRSRFLTPAWQVHALEGRRLSAQREAVRRQNNEVSVELTLVSLQAFRAVFGDPRADELLRQFSIEKDEKAKASRAAENET